MPCQLCYVFVLKTIINLLDLYKMKRYLILAIICCGIPCIAQNVPEKFMAYGYNTKSKEYVVEPAQYAVRYLRTQVVLNDATNENESLKDTLTLAIGQTSSVFFNPFYTGRSSAWSKQNVAKSKKVSKPIVFNPVPLSTVLDKKEKARDFFERNLGELLSIYTNRISKTTTTILSLRSIMSVQKIREFQNWGITQEIDTVLGYKCSRATVNYAGRDYIAWFTTDIPVSAGPWKFYGLPGLILKVEDSENLFLFEAIGIENQEDAYITMNDNFEIVKVGYLNKQADEEKSNIMGTFLFDGEMITTTSHPYTYTEMEQ